MNPYKAFQNSVERGSCHFIDISLFLSERYTFNWNETLILKTVEEIPAKFKNITRDYLYFLKEKIKILN